MGTTKTTDQLEQGDRVNLGNGHVRTVATVECAGYETMGDGPGRVVHYVEGAHLGWGPANSAGARSSWQIAGPADEVLAQVRARRMATNDGSGVWAAGRRVPVELDGRRWELLVVEDVAGGHRWDLFVVGPLGGSQFWANGTAGMAGAAWLAGAHAIAEHTAALALALAGRPEVIFP